jgi:hypothetical protein
MKRLIFTLAFIMWASIAAAQTHTFNLSWTLGPIAADNSNAPTGVKVERKTGTAGTFAQIAQVGVVTTAQNVVQNPAPGGVQYCFRVRSFNATGDGPYSNEACGQTAAVIVPAVPNAPSGFTVSAISSSTLRMSWEDNSDNETGFQVQAKRATGQPYSVVANVATDITTYDWTGRLRYKTYCAQVRAVGTSGNSAWTPASCATTSK